MSSLIYWLVATAFLTAILWLPYVSHRLLTLQFRALGNPSPDWPEPPEWAKRAKVAHANAVENLVVFTPLVLGTQLAGVESSLAVLAAQLYFWARLGHYVVFTGGVPGLRTVFFLVGFGAQVTLGLTTLNALSGGA